MPEQAHSQAGPVGLLGERCPAAHDGRMDRATRVRDEVRQARHQAPRPVEGPARSLLTLQRTAGNRAVSVLLEPPGRLLQRQPDTEYVPTTGAPDVKPQPETAPEVLGRKDLDDVFRRNPTLLGRVQTVATELDLDPGLLAASLLAESSASTWSRRSGTVPSEELGMDDWFSPAVQPRLRRIIDAHPGLRLRLTDVKTTGEEWDTSTEKAGGGMKPRGELDAHLAVAAFGVYMKMQENLLSAVIANRGKETADLAIRALDDLTPEQRLTVLRVGLNAGVGVGLKLFLKLAKGGDIPRTGKNTRNPKNPARTAVLHVARAIHLAQEIFGRPSSDYRPATGRLTNRAAAEIFDRPEVRNLPDVVVPFYY